MRRIYLFFSFLIIFFALFAITISSPAKVLGANLSGCHSMSSFSNALMLKNPSSGSHNAYIEIQSQDESNNSLNIERNSKLEFFFKYIPRSGSLYQSMPIFVRTKGDLTSPREQLNLTPYSDKFKLQYIYNSNEVNYSITSTDSFDKNCWKHVVIVYRSHSLELYLDGRLQGTIEGISITSGNSPQNKLIFGRNLATASNLKNGFNGILDEIRITNIAEDAQINVPSAPVPGDADTFLLAHLNCNLEDESGKNTISNFGQTVFVKPATTSISYPLLASCGPTSTPIPTVPIGPSNTPTPTPTAKPSPTITPTPTPKPFTKTHFCSPSPSQSKNNVPCFTLPIFLTPRSLASQRGIYTKTLRGNSYYREVFTARDDDGDFLNLQFTITGVRNSLVALPGSQGSNCNTIPTPTPAPKVRGTITYTICGFIPNVSSSIPENQRHINIHYSLDDAAGGVVAGDYRLSFY